MLEPVACSWYVDNVRFLCVWLCRSLRQARVARISYIFNMYIYRCNSWLRSQFALSFYNDDENTAKRKANYFCLSSCASCLQSISPCSDLNPFCYYLLYIHTRDNIVSCAPIYQGGEGMCACHAYIHNVHMARIFAPEKNWFMRALWRVSTFRIFTAKALKKLNRIISHTAIYYILYTQRTLIRVKR